MIVFFLLIVEDADTAVKGDSACFLVIIDVWLIADDLESNVSEEVFLKGDNREYFGLVTLFGFLYHLLVHLVYG